MKKFAYSLALLFLWPLLAGAQTVTLPATAKAKVGRLASINVVYDGDALQYVIIGEPTKGGDEGFDVFREASDDAKSVKLRVIGYAPGQCSVVAVTVKGGKLSPFAVCVVTFEGSTPPTPPTPPVPPVPPTPDDPFVKALQTTYSAEKDAAALGFLQAAYAGMAAQAGSQPIKTNADALKWMKAVVETPPNGLTATQITATRRLIAAELSQTFGNVSNAPIRLDVLAGEMGKIAKALSQVK